MAVPCSLGCESDGSQISVERNQLLSVNSFAPVSPARLSRREWVVVVHKLFGRLALQFRSALALSVSYACGQGSHAYVAIHFLV